MSYKTQVCYYNKINLGQLQVNNKYLVKLKERISIFEVREQV